MAGMFDKLMGGGAAPAPQGGGLDSQKLNMLVSMWSNKVPGTSPEQVRAAIMGLLDQKVPLTNANIADALMGK